MVAAAAVVGVGAAGARCRPRRRALDDPGARGEWLILVRKEAAAAHSLCTARRRTRRRGGWPAGARGAAPWSSRTERAEREALQRPVGSSLGSPHHPRPNPGPSRGSSAAHPPALLRCPLFLTHTLASTGGSSLGAAPASSCHLASSRRLSHRTCPRTSTACAAAPPAIRAIRAAACSLLGHLPVPPAAPPAASDVPPSASRDATGGAGGGGRAELGRGPMRSRRRSRCATPSRRRRTGACRRPHEAIVLSPAAATEQDEEPTEQDEAYGAGRGAYGAGRGHGAGRGAYGAGREPTEQTRSLRSRTRSLRSRTRTRRRGTRSRVAQSESQGTSACAAAARA